jgi:ribosomal-protein-alanine N-acetyltransferase
MSGNVLFARGSLADLDAVDALMIEAFDAEYGEAWTRAQLDAVLAMPGVWLTLARQGRRVVGFSLHRIVLDEAELLLLAIAPEMRRRGIGRGLIERGCAEAKSTGARRLHLEVREGNPATALYQSAGFAAAGRRREYYRGVGGQVSDALTLTRDLTSS